MKKRVVISLIDESYLNWHFLGLCLYKVVQLLPIPEIGQRLRASRSLRIASCSGVVLPIHSSFVIAGFEQFDLPVSILLILATFIISIVQIVLTLFVLARFCDR